VNWPMISNRSVAPVGTTDSAVSSCRDRRAAALSGEFAVTGTLTVRFERSVRTGSAVRFEAKLANIDGRKITTSATAHSDGQLNATAHAVFISVGRERYTESNAAPAA
jgi:predicted thioesterase